MNRSARVTWGWWVCEGVCCSGDKAEKGGALFEKIKATVSSCATASCPCTVAVAAEALHDDVRGPPARQKLTPPHTCALAAIHS